MLKSTTFAILLLFVCSIVGAQSARVPLGADDYYNLDRVQTKVGRLSDTLCLSDKAEYRKDVTAFAQRVLNDLSENGNKGNLSQRDIFNLQQIVAENREWSTSARGADSVKRHSDPYNMLFFNKKNFLFSINPVVSLGGSFADESTSISKSNNIYGLGVLGVTGRGRIGKRIGFEFLATGSAERFNDAMSIYSYRSATTYIIPGAGMGNWSDNYRNVMYAQLTGAVDIAVLKDYVNVTVGNGKHFIGDGTTSLFLTDFSANMPYMQLRARVWKLNYDVIYAQLTPQFESEVSTPKTLTKYTTMHYITLNVTKWMNLGFFESVVFSRDKSYEVSYLNPIALTIAANAYNGEYDKSLVGLTSKFYIAKHIQLYAQMMFNEFKSDEFFSNKGWYGNKWGFQSGIKYFDVLGVQNLDMQGEFTCVRPYTYTAKSTDVDYTHYNQPLADPLGAGYMKYVVNVRYQPLTRLVASLNFVYYKNGLDSGGFDNGNNIFIPYVNAPAGSKTYGVNMLNGAIGQCNMVNFNLSYKIRGGIYFDLGYGYRKYEIESGRHPLSGTIGSIDQNSSASSVNFGLRANIARRNNTFY